MPARTVITKKMYSQQQQFYEVFPHLSGPELPSLHLVLQVVTDDVGFLQEEAHGVCQVCVLPNDGIFQL